MIHTMFCCLNRKISNEKVAAAKQQLKLDETKAIIYRDELTKPSKAVKKSVRFADSEQQHAILGSQDDNKKDFMKGGSSSTELGGGERESNVIRVKVKMTKEEAARLLSKCKEGGVLEFKDVARLLVALPPDRVSFL